MKEKKLMFFLALLVLIGAGIAGILVSRARRFDRILESRYGRPAIQEEEVNR